MWPVLISLIIGLAIAFERILSLNRADINAQKFLGRVKEALDNGGVSAAEEVCANTRGPVASVVQAGLTRFDEDMDAVEKAVVSYGSIEMSSWSAAWCGCRCLSRSPRCSGSSGRWSAWSRRSTPSRPPATSAVARGPGIKIALLTTVFGLIAAIILQVFYNYCVSKIDRITADMEEASVELIDSLAMMSVGRPALSGRARTALPRPSTELGTGDDLTGVDLS